MSSTIIYMPSTKAYRLVDLEKARVGTEWTRHPSTAASKPTTSFGSTSSLVSYFTTSALVLSSVIVGNEPQTLHDYIIEYYPELLL